MLWILVLMLGPKRLLRPERRGRVRRRLEFRARQIWPDITFLYTLVFRLACTYLPRLLASRECPVLELSTASALQVKPGLQVPTLQA